MRDEENMQSPISSLQHPISNVQSPLGFLTAYVPEELFHAAGFTPIFIFHTPDIHGFARAHLPGFTCWVAGSAFDQALAGELDGIAGMALAQTCDTMQGLTDLWRRNVSHIPLFHFGMPLRLDGPSARAYLLSELESLRERVQGTTGHPISDGALRESIALYNRTRALVRRLYARAARGDIAPPDLYGLVRAAFQMPKETYNQEIESRMQDAGPLSAPRLIIVGPALADPVLFDITAQAGARLVGDLLDLGERYFAVDVAEDGPPLEALANRLLALVPTPTKYHPQRTRAAHLLSLVRERGADGLIFARQKFCDPHGFDYAQLARILDQAGVPHLLVELEQASQAGQLRTRVEAFVEMLA
ncbi:MAG: 2-hydroxyacyl-CoA dehydratase family protein [Chloroflexota bacterium]|nr:2-hydroxyacyl-CoA dehydratase family protein [Chloroflexota bacterium]